MAREPMPDVIVLLPGIMGSVLEKDGREVWALSGSALLRGIFSLGQSVRDLALAQDDPTAEDVDGVSATRLMPDAHLIPGFWKIDGYTRIADAIKAKFDVEPNKNYFEFAYDWRRDNRAAAHRLERESATWLAEWKQQFGVGASDPKLILIGHSMGGLVARYFVEVLGGWQRTKAVITIGTPFRGSLNALDTLVHGVKKGPLNLSPLVRTFTSAYQLLPIYACLDVGTDALVRVGDAGTPAIPNVDRQKAAEGLAFHRKIEEENERNRGNEAYRTGGHRSFLVVGSEQPTNQSATMRGNEVKLLRTHDGKDNRGDGTVPRVSATPIELSDAGREAFFATRHASLQNADGALVHVEQAIRDLYLNLGAFRGPEPPTTPVGLDVEDAYWANEPILVRAIASDELALEATITGPDGAETVAPLRPDGSDGYAHEFPAQPPGTYRVSVTGGSEPAEDVFVVLDERAEDV